MFLEPCSNESSSTKQMHLTENTGAAHNAATSGDVGSHPNPDRTLFGNIELRIPRLFQCPCQPRDTKTCSPLGQLLSEHTSPELLYMGNEWASPIAYGATTKMLKDVLPVDEKLCPPTVRNQSSEVAEREEASLGDEQVFFIEGCARDWANLPRPEGPITVGIDGGYVRDWTEKKRHFEVIVGECVPRDGAANCFGFVQSYDTKPKRRLFSVLESLGMQMNQQTTFLSDGGDTVRDLQLYLNPELEHLSDWFHVTMRITVLDQYAKGVIRVDRDVGESLRKAVESTKWYLWHGNAYEALQKISDIDGHLTILTSDTRNSRLFRRRSTSSAFTSIGTRI